MNARSSPGGRCERASAAARRLVARSLFLIVLAATPAAAPQTPERVPEEVMKGIIVEKLTRFIEWPPGRLAPDSRFVLCATGTGTLIERLVTLARAMKFKGHDPDVRRVRDTKEMLGCHLVFIAQSEGGRLPEILAALAGKPILSVSDTPGFAARGVLVNLYREEQFVRFEVNIAAAKQSGLTFNSRLLRIARLVGQPPR